MKKVPLRSCAVTKEKCEKNDLFRIVRTPEKEVVYDQTGKQNGKGAYLKKDKDVVLKAKKTKVLERLLEVNIPDEIYDMLLERLENEQA